MLNAKQSASSVHVVNLENILQKNSKVSERDGESAQRIGKVIPALKQKNGRVSSALPSVTEYPNDTPRKFHLLQKTCLPPR